MRHALDRGCVIVLADSSFLANKLLGSEDNAILAANLGAYAVAQARGERIAFDEYHLGYGATVSGWTILGTALWRTSLGWGVLCLLAGGALFVLYRGRRFGTRYPPSRMRRRTKIEYVQSVGATYRAAGAHALTFEITHNWFRRKAAAVVGLPPSASVEALAAAMAKRTPHSARHYEQILRSCEEALAKERLGARRISALLDQLVSVEREVLDGRRTRK
ncbi:MAG: hypothetical protein JW889_12020 [Verrucomicrobia bacterium]|nr:hypothetical protein [Verrucomicrobiota bacterium]